MKNGITVCLTLALLCVGNSRAVQAAAYDELNPAQQKELQAGKQVIITVDVPGHDWPKVSVYQRIQSTPEEAQAVFADFDIQKNYIPEMLKSEIKTYYTPVRIRVDYELELPWPLSNESYSVEDDLSIYDKGASYRTDWHLIRADSTQDIQGNARFETLGTGTLLVFYNFVTPGSSFASWVKGQAIEKVQSSAQAVATQVEKERAENQALLTQQIARLRKAFADAEGHHSF